MQKKTAEIALASARRMPKQKLLDGLTALYDADSKLKGGAAEPRAILEFLVARLTS